MQQMMSRRQPQNNGNTQVQTMIITAITLFALSGLMVGFAFGAFTRPHTTNPQTNKKTTIITPAAHNTPTPTPTPQTQPVPLGFPHIPSYVPTELADGTTTYTVKAFPVDQSKSKTDGNPIQAANVTCKIWFSKNSPDDITKQLLNSQDKLKDINAVTQPLPSEEQNVLTFENSQQTQLCNPTGDVTTWTYKVAPNTDPGSYILVVLTDWAGQRYNWAFDAVTIQKAN